MKLSNVIFINTFPTLDLHGYDRDTARVKILEFINDNITMGNEFITIVHGVGSGILRKETYEVLKRSKKVVEHQVYRANAGCTIVKLVKKWFIMLKLDNEVILC